jgi:hypothetical protein
VRNSARPGGSHAKRLTRGLEKVRMPILKTVIPSTISDRSGSRQLSHLEIGERA